MTAKTAKDAIVVPTAAVFKNTEGAEYVVLAGSDEKAHQKKVQVGIRSGDEAQIVAGINPGDPVITQGGYALPDGTQIKIEKPGAEDKASGDAADDEKKDSDDTAGKKSEAKKKGSPASDEKSARSGKE
jgi:hypothetical protein